MFGLLYTFILHPTLLSCLCLGFTVSSSFDWLSNIPDSKVTWLSRMSYCYQTHFFLRVCRGLGMRLLDLELCCNNLALDHHPSWWAFVGVRVNLVNCSRVAHLLNLVTLLSGLVYNVQLR